MFRKANAAASVTPPTIPCSLPLARKLPFITISVRMREEDQRDLEAPGRLAGHLRGALQPVPRLEIHHLVLGGLQIAAQAVQLVDAARNLRLEIGNTGGIRLPDQPELPLEIEVAQAAVESLELVFENLIGALLLGLDPGDDPLLGLIEGLGACPGRLSPPLAAPFSFRLSVVLSCSTSTTGNTSVEAR